MDIYKYLTSPEKISDILIPRLAIIIPSLAIFVPRLAIFIPRLGMSKFNRLLVPIQRTSSNNSIDFWCQSNRLLATILYIIRCLHNALHAPKQ